MKRETTARGGAAHFAGVPACGVLPASQLSEVRREVRAVRGLPGQRVLGRPLPKVEQLPDGDKAEFGVRDKRCPPYLVGQRLLAAAEPQRSRFHGISLASTGVALFSWTPKIAWIGRGCSLERRGQGGPKR